ncbi:hypothetical protein LJR296_007990 [Cupriavidus necator]|uniref:hypothetical protein n=1 Tax=Cupriavidus necator TaxID=106590 RepID=UPI003ECEED7C
MALMGSANLRFAVFILTLLGVGASMGYALAGHQRLIPYKLLNIAGIIYGLVGVLVLSEMVAKSDPLKKFMVHWVAGGLIWAHTVIPIGALIGAGVGHALSLPSAAITAKFFVSFFFYSIFVLGVVDSVVFFPRMKRFQGPASRTQAFGLILLITGLVVQLLAALQDFNG